MGTSLPNKTSSRYYLMKLEAKKFLRIIGTYLQIYTASHFTPLSKGGGSNFLRNVGRPTYLSNYTASNSSARKMTTGLSVKLEPIYQTTRRYIPEFSNYESNSWKFKPSAFSWTLVMAYFRKIKENGTVLYKISWSIRHCPGRNAYIQLGNVIAQYNVTVLILMILIKSNRIAKKISNPLQL
jgi:hypothetical protein